MKIECTVEELKELLNKETPVAGTTDVKNMISAINQEAKINELNPLF